MSKSRKKPGPVEEKVILEYDSELKFDGGDFILKLQETYSDLISKGCSTTFIKMDPDCREFDDDSCEVRIIFSGIRERTQGEIEKEEAKKQEEKKLVQEMEELRKKLAELKKS